MNAFKDYASKIYLSATPAAPENTRSAIHAAKLARALEYLGKKHCVARFSTLIYVRAGTAVPNRAGIALSGLRGPCPPVCRVA